VYDGLDSNYGGISYRLRDIAIDLLVENREIIIPHLYLSAPAGGDPVGIA